MLFKLLWLLVCLALASLEELVGSINRLFAAIFCFKIIGITTIFDKQKPKI